LKKKKNPRYETDLFYPFSLRQKSGGSWAPRSGNPFNWLGRRREERKIFGKGRRGMGQGLENATYTTKSGGGGTKAIFRVSMLGREKGEEDTQ